MPSTPPEKSKLPDSVDPAKALQAIALLFEIAKESQPSGFAEFEANPDAAMSLPGAHELKDRLLEALPEMVKVLEEPPPVDAPNTGEVMRGLLRYVMRHPNAITKRGEETVYSRGFQCFVVNLASPGQPGANLSRAELASCVDVPLETLETWFVVKPTVPRKKFKNKRKRKR